MASFLDGLRQWFERCRTGKCGYLMRRVFGPVLLWHAATIFGLTIAVTWGMLSYIQSIAERARPETMWAEITELHASWDDDEGQVWLSMRFNRRAECAEILVNKDVQRVIEGEVTGELIKINGKLPDKFMDAPDGESFIFDIASPRGPIRPGRYVVHLAASCLFEDGRLEPTSPKTAELRVPENRS